MNKELKVGIFSAIGVALFLLIFAFQNVVVSIIGGVVAGLFAALLVTRLPNAIRAGLLAGLAGLVFMLTYGIENPAIAILGGMISGLSAGLLASQNVHEREASRGVVQGALAGLVAGLLTVATLFLVWLIIANAAGISSLDFVERLQETVPLGSGFGNDITLIGLLSFWTILGAVFFGAASGAARTYEGQRGNIMLFSVIGLLVFLIPILNNALDYELLNSIIPLYVFLLLALGLNIVVGYAGLLDLGYAAFFAIGAYTAGILSSPHIGTEGVHVSFWLVIWIAAAVAAVAGVILGAPTLPLRGDYLAIVTLGFGEIVPIMVRNFGGGGNGSISLEFLGIKLVNQLDLTGGVAGINPIDPPRIGDFVFGATTQLAWYYLIVGLMAITIFFINRLRGSRQGRAWTAMREDELAADAMGIDIVKTKLLAFAMGATFSGFAGAFYGAYITAIFPTTFDFSVSIIILCMVILGGLGNMAGVLVGGLLITGADRLFLPEAGKVIKKIAENQDVNNLANYRDITQWRLLLFGLVLVIMMIVRPEGLLPSARRKAELHPDDDDIADQQNATLYDAERDPNLSHN